MLYYVFRVYINDRATTSLIFAVRVHVHVNMRAVQIMYSQYTAFKNAQQMF